jgi:hypothetical protein
MFVPLVPAAKNTRHGSPAALLGAGMWRHARGDGAHCPSGRHGAKCRGLNHHFGFKSFRKFSNFRGLGCSRYLGAHHHHQAVTEFSPAAVSAGSPCSVASFEVNSRAPNRGTSLGPLVCGANKQPRTLTTAFMEFYDDIFVSFPFLNQLTEPIGFVTWIMVESLSVSLKRK